MFYTNSLSSRASTVQVATAKFPTIFDSFNLMLIVLAELKIKGVSGGGLEEGKRLFKN